MAADGFLSLKDTRPRVIKANQEIHLDIRGDTKFRAETPQGRHLLALYANLELPAPGTEGRKALARGGWRAWFQQVSAPVVDTTGYLGPVPISEHGTAHLLIAHTWPHTVGRDPWEFCIKLYAFDAAGKPADVALRLSTREIKIIADRVA